MDELRFIKVQHKWQYDPFSDPPLGMLSVAAVAREKIPRLKVTLSDMACDIDASKESSWSDFSEKIPESDFYGLSCSTLEFPGTLEIAQRIKKRIPESSIIVGGPHFDVFPESYWKKKISDLPFDLICRGEGELNIEEAIELARNKQRKIIISQKAPLLDMDSLPLPARDLLDKEKYFESGKTFAGGNAKDKQEKKINGNSSTIMVSRGCPYQCGFCASPEIHHRRLRFRNLDNVIMELDFLKGNYEVGSLRWQDDNIPLNFKMQKGLEDVLHERQISSRGSARSDQIQKHPEILDKLWYAGFREIGFGVESAEDYVLKILKKGVVVEQNKFALKETKRRGFRTRAFVMTGLPGETKDSAKKMIDFLEETNPDVVTLTSFVPLPGSDVYNNPQNYGVTIKSSNWAEYDIALKWDSGVEWTHRISSVSLDEMERNREELKEYLFNKGKSNVSIYNKHYESSS